MSLAACCTSASSWSSVMSRHEREGKTKATGRPFGLVRDLDGLHGGLDQFFAIYTASGIDPSIYRLLPSSAWPARRARSPSASSSSLSASSPRLWLLRAVLLLSHPRLLISWELRVGWFAASTEEGTCSESPRASMSSSRPCCPERSSPSSSTPISSLISSFGRTALRHPPPHREAWAIETRSFSLAPLEISRKNSKDRAEYL